MLSENVPAGYRQLGDIAVTIYPNGTVDVIWDAVDDPYISYQSGVITIKNTILAPDISLYKVDEQNAWLAGVGFTMTGKSNGYVGTGTTDGNGLLTLRDCPKTMLAKYTIRETGRPAQYEQIADIVIEIDTAGAITIISDPDGAASVNPGTPGSITVKNTKLPEPQAPDVHIIKRSDAATPMEGVTFTLTGKDNTYTSTKQTDANGAIDFDPLPATGFAGEYILRETPVPEYTVVSDVVITVNPDGTIQQPVWSAADNHLQIALS